MKLLKRQMTFDSLVRYLKVTFDIFEYEDAYGNPTVEAPPILDT